MSDLTNARLKIERAKHHIDDLSTMKGTFLQGNPYGVTPEYYPEHDFTVFYLDRFTALPRHLPLIAGDAIHNLRSALDLLAYALIGRQTTPGTNVYFPICETSEKYKADSPRKVEGMSLIDKAAIGKLKPYGGGNDNLWGLHQMDIADKHRLISTPVTSIGKIGFRESVEAIERDFKGLIRFKERDAIPEQTIWFDMATQSSKILAFKTGDPVACVAGNHELHQDVELTFDIALGEPEVFKGRPLLPTLHQLADLVTGIVDSFELL